MQFASVIHRFDGDMWGHYVPVPDEVSVHFLDLPTGRRVLCTINGKHTIHCALMPQKGAEHFIMMSKNVLRKLDLTVGSPVQLSIVPDESTYGMAMCEEMEEVLRQDEVASAHFEKLTPGKQRNLIHFVGNVKSSSIRVRRAIVVMEHLVIHHGSIDFKALNAEIKAANQRERRV